MSVPVAFTSRQWSCEVEHRTTDSSDATVDSGTDTRHADIPVKSPSRLVRMWGQPVNGNAGTEWHVAYKVVRPYGTWVAITPIIDEAVSLLELAWTLDSEGACAAAGILVGSILRVTGVVAGDTPDRVIKRVVRVTGVAVLPGQPDVITVRDIWTSVDRAFDTAATLELYDLTHVDSSHITEDIWRDVTPDCKINEAITAGETALTLSAEGAAAAAGIVVGSIIRHSATATVAAVPGTEIMLVTAITLSGGNPDVLTVLLAYGGSLDIAFDNDASKLEVLQGRIIEAKVLGNDNVRYIPASMDNDYMDFEDRSFLRSIAIGAAECRVGALFVPYQAS